MTPFVIIIERIECSMRFKKGTIDLRRDDHPEGFGRSKLGTRRKH